jgi:hypothetical protein
MPRAVQEMGHRGEDSLRVWQILSSDGIYPAVAKIKRRSSTVLQTRCRPFPEGRRSKPSDDTAMAIHVRELERAWEIMGDVRKDWIQICGECNHYTLESYSMCGALLMRLDRLDEAE